MRSLAVATALTVALLTGVSVAVAGDVGANDDSAKFSEDGGAALYARMAGLGLKQTVIGARFVPSEALVVDLAELRAIRLLGDAGLVPRLRHRATMGR